MREYARQFLYVLGDARRRLPAVLGLMFASAGLDLVGLGLIVPLIIALGGAASDQAGAFPLWLPFDALTDPWIVTAICAGLATAFVLKGFAAVRVQRAIVTFSDRHRSELMSRLMASYLAQPYEFHLRRNSAEAVERILNTSYEYATRTLGASLRIVVDALTLLVIIGFLSAANWVVLLLLVVPLAIAMVLFVRATRARTARAGEEVSVTSTELVRVVNHAVGAIREVRVLGVEQSTLADLRVQADRLAEASAGFSALLAIPRVVVEAMMVALFAGLTLLAVWNYVEGSSIFLVLGVLGFAAMRVMPGVTSLIGSINALIHSREALRLLYEDLRAPSAPLAAPRRSGGAARGFRHVRIEDVTYAYPGESRPAVAGLSMAFGAGQAIGIVGRSGAGKSTAVDLLLGLLRPGSGRILVDGRDIQEDLRAWMDVVAYIPQSVFLTDDSLVHNIAFGQDAASVDRARLEMAVRASQLDELVRDLPRGLDTVVGERGVRLSGGQRQRVALARALYFDRELIVMDEATSALDTETEREVIRAIGALHGKKTLVIIAHRISTLKGCDAIFALEGGRVREVTSYDALAAMAQAGAG